MLFYVFFCALSLFLFLLLPLFCLRNLFFPFWILHLIFFCLYFPSSFYSSLTLLSSSLLCFSFSFILTPSFRLLVLLLTPCFKAKQSKTEYILTLIFKRLLLLCRGFLGGVLQFNWPTCYCKVFSRSHSGHFTVWGRIARILKFTPLIVMGSIK